MGLCRTTYHIGLPFRLFPSSGRLFLYILTLASFICFPLCATYGAFDTDHRRIASTADIGDLALSDTPICGIVVDSKSVDSQNDIYVKDALTCP